MHRETRVMLGQPVFAPKAAAYTCTGSRSRWRADALSLVADGEPRDCLQFDSLPQFDFLLKVLGS